PALAAEVRRQQQILIVQLMPALAGVNILNAGLVSLLFSAHADPRVIACWYAVVFSCCVYQFWVWLRLRRRPIPEHVSGRGLRRAAAFTFVQGLLWGATALTHYPAENAPLQMVLTLTAAGMIAGTVAMMNPIPSCTVRFVVGVSAPFTMRLLLEGEALHATAAVMGLAFAAALYFGSLRSYWQLKEMVRSNLQTERAKTVLDNAIEASNDGFAIFDADARLVTANSRYRHWFPDQDEMRGEPGGEMRQVADGSWVLSKNQSIDQGGFVSVHADVTALKRREEELTHAKQVAEEADRAKVEFLSNMGHELRTPLNAIIGFAQIMEQQIYGEMGDPRYLEHVDEIRQGGKRLLTVINDILDMARIESSRYELEEDELDVAPAIDWVIGVCREQEEEGGERAVEVEEDVRLHCLLVDPRAFKKILINLVGNALKFSEEGSPAGVRTRLEEDGSAVFTVWDRGKGIPADRLEEVTRPFIQVQSVLRKTHQGSGLGLAIAKSLTEMHGGALTIRSAVDEGTEVEVRLPAACVVDPDEGPVELLKRVA
ncbi:MAG: ATP-binding protein, partial [Caulobacterales bacterium]|nr:ATP-binding protein [Caulobacterales bacterium]